MMIFPLIPHDEMFRVCEQILQPQQGAYFFIERELIFDHDYISG